MGAALPLALEKIRSWSATEDLTKAATADMAGRGSENAAVSADAHRLRTVFLAGALGGLFPDIDIFIRSQADPLLAIEFHRHFTHSLFFVPLGGAFIASLLFGIYRFAGKTKRSWLELWRWASLGMLTHGLLDACTSYGTRLLWPFSDVRISWHNISIVDPIYTLPLLCFAILAVLRKRVQLARWGLCLSLVYLGLGLWQRERARSIYAEEIARRGHEAVRMEVKPGFSNLWLWRSIYEADDHFYVDAIWNPPFRAARIYPGGRTRKLDPEVDFAYLPADSVARRDIDRFAFFSDSFLYAVGDDPYTIGDLRMSLLPHSLEPLWVIRVDPDRPDEHLPYITVREVTEQKRSLFWSMLKGQNI